MTANLPVWRADMPEPERYNIDVGGDIQASDVWYVRLVNDQNGSTVSVNVYATVTEVHGEGSGEFEYGVDALLEWDDPAEGYEDIEYDTSHPLAYDTSEEAFEAARHEAIRWIRMADEFIQWDGHQRITP